jgi:hypothetical protein
MTIDPILERQFSRVIQCAKQTGIYDCMFLAFGSLLGYVRERGVIVHDHDMDMGIIRSGITQEQEREYQRLIREPCAEFPGQRRGITEYRDDFCMRPDDHRFFWHSLRAAPQGQGRSCCHWYFFDHKGYAWHAKGPQAKVKGCPAQYVVQGPEVRFLQTTVHVPMYAGALLDWWYPGNWLVPQPGGNSSDRVTMDVPDWTKPDGWVIKGG